MPRLFNIAVLALLSLVASYSIAMEYGWIDLATDPIALIEKAKQSGRSGGMVIIGLMALAVVFNPVPSAPIALASGAVYGHTFGTIYIVIGAFIGAMVAFFIARIAGKELVAKVVGERLPPSWIGSQNSMTIAVLATRLIPFISFDLASYGAGLTPLKPWRFALATLIGLLPASFLLAHFGSELSTESLERSMVLVMIAGGLVILPLLAGSILRARR